MGFMTIGSNNYEDCILSNLKGTENEAVAALIKKIFDLQINGVCDAYANRSKSPYTSLTRA